MPNQPTGNHWLGVFCGQICPWSPPPCQMKIAKLKSAYNSLIIVPKGFQCQANL